MRLFDPGKAKSSTQPGDLSPADVASRLFAIKLLLGRLQQTGGSAGTFGNYISKGPSQLPSGLVGGASSDLLNALSQPNAFRRGPTVTTGTPSSPSAFQDIAGGGITALLLAQALGLTPGNALTGMSSAGGTVTDFLRKLFSQGINNSSGTGLGTLGPNDQIGMTMDPNAQIGMTMASPAFDLSSNDMSSVLYGPNASDLASSY